MSDSIDSLFGPPPVAPGPEKSAQASSDSLFGDLPVPTAPSLFDAPAEPEKSTEPEKPAEGDDKQHVRHSPSSAPRWTRCPGSIIATDGLESRAGDAADEGTAAHWMLEQCLLQDKSTEELADEYPTILGQNKRWPAAGEMAETLEPIVEEYRKEGAKRGVILIPERKLFLHEALGLSEPVGGTADITIFRARARSLGIEDLKYGKNVKVKAAETDADGKEVPNEQLMTYLAAAYFDWLENHSKESKSPVEKLYICIRQPRMKLKRDRKSVFECSVEYLLEWVEWFKERFQATLDPAAPRVPGEKQCTFCLAKNKPERCPEYSNQGAGEAKKFLDTVKDKLPAGMTPADLFAKDPANMTATELNAARMLADDYERQARAIKVEVENRLVSGQKLPGWKLVHGNRTRYFTDATRARQAADALAAAGVDRALLFDPPKPEALLSVAQIEKNVSADEWAEHFKPLEGSLAGKAAVAPASSKKAEYNAQLVGENAAGDWEAESLPTNQEQR